jgi:hypothetical protein
MNCPYCETSSLTTDGLEMIAICKKCNGDWMTGRRGGALFKDNLIYLPFARHLAEEDEAPQKKAA